MSDERKPTSKEAQARIGTLEQIVRDTLWMARRYAHGRMTYATSMYNDAARQAVALIPDLRQTDGTWFAPDGHGPNVGGLTPEEHAQAIGADDFYTSLREEELRRSAAVDQLIRAVEAMLASPNQRGGGAISVGLDEIDAICRAMDELRALGMAAPAVMPGETAEGGP